MDALRRASAEKNPIRPILPRRRYEPPPAQEGRRSPFAMDTWDHSKRSRRQRPDGQLAELLGSESNGFSRLVAREVAFRATGDIATPVGQVDWSAVRDAVSSDARADPGRGGLVALDSALRGHDRGVRGVSAAPTSKAQCDVEDIASISEAVERGFADRAGAERRGRRSRAASQLVRPMLEAIAARRKSVERRRRRAGTARARRPAIRSRSRQPARRSCAYAHADPAGPGARCRSTAWTSGWTRTRRPRERPALLPRLQPGPRRLAGASRRWWPRPTASLRTWTTWTRWSGSPTTRAGCGRCATSYARPASCETAPRSPSRRLGRASRARRRRRRRTRPQPDPGAAAGRLRGAGRHQRKGERARHLRPGRPGGRLAARSPAARLARDRAVAAARRCRSGCSAAPPSLQRSTARAGRTAGWRWTGRRASSCAASVAGRLGWSRTSTSRRWTSRRAALTRRPTLRVLVEMSADAVRIILGLA